MAISWTKLYKDYKGLWVALADDEKTVLASDKNLKKVIDKSSKLGHDKPILFKVPTKTIPYVGAI